MTPKAVRRSLNLPFFPSTQLHFTVGYSPERCSGPVFTNYHLAGNDFNYPQNLNRADDYRFGAEPESGIDLISAGFRVSVMIVCRFGTYEHHASLVQLCEQFQ